MPFVEIDNVRLSHGFAAFGAVPNGAARGMPPSVVALLDLGTGATKLIGKSRYPNGQTDWVAITGEYVAWTDEDATADDNAPAVAWDLHVTNFATGADRVIASSHGVKDLEVPLPVADDGVIVWGQFAHPLNSPSANQSSLTQDLHVYDTSTVRDRVVFSNPELGSFGETNGCLIYTVGAPTASTSSPQGSPPDIPANVFEVPLAGGHSVEVEKSEDLNWFAVGDGRVTWQEPATGEPDSLWTMTVPKGCGRTQPVQVEEGDSSGNAIGGRNFVAYWDHEDSVQVVGLGVDGETSASMAASRQMSFIPARIDARGDQLAWAEQPGGDGPVTVMVATVPPPDS